MYGTLRFLYENALTSDMITVTNQASGAVTGTLKTGTGDAVLALAGSYSGDNNRLYTVQIDDVSGGDDIGNATFAWRSSESPDGFWEASGVSTDDEIILLEDGIYVYWLTGGEFDLYDYWNWKVFSRYQAGNMLDWDWHTTYRSATLASPNEINIDLGSAQTLTTIVIAGHNLTSGATVTLKAGTTAACADYTNALSVANVINEYFSEEYRYWKVQITDAANPDGYIEIAHLYLGTYVELSVPNADWGASLNTRKVLQESVNPAGVVNRYVFSEQRILDLAFPIIYAADVASLQAIFDDCLDTDTGASRPLFIHLFSDSADHLFLMDLPEELPLEFRIYNIYSTSFTLTEAVRAV